MTLIGRSKDRPLDSRALSGDPKRNGQRGGGNRSGPRHVQVCGILPRATSEKLARMKILATFFLAAALPLAAAQTPDAGPDQNVLHPQAAQLAGSVAGRTPLEWWTADGNGASEDMLVKYLEGVGVTSVGPLQTGGGQIYGWPGDLVDVNGTIYGTVVLLRQLFTLDPQTGICTPVGAPYPAQYTSVHSLAFDPTGGWIYGIDMGSKQLLRIDPLTAAVTAIGSGTLAGYPGVKSLAYDDQTSTLYANDQATDSLVSISPVTGAVTFVGTMFPFPNGQIEDMQFLDGELYAVNGRTSSGSLIGGLLNRVDTATGDATWLPPEVLNVSPHCLLLRSVPEPIAWSQSSGPGTATFSDSRVLDPTVTFSKPGVYALQLSVETLSGPAVDALEVASAGDEAFCFGDGSGMQCGCGNTGGPGEGCANSTGFGALLVNQGGVGTALDDASLSATQLPANRLGMIYLGNQPYQYPGFTGQSLLKTAGIRCVGGKLRRLPIGGTGPSGVLTADGPVALSAGLIGAGETWYFQSWYRDGNQSCGTGSNFSNALAITFAP